MSSSEPDVPYVPKYPMMKGFTRNDVVPTRKEWDDLVLRCPKAYGRIIANILRESGAEESKINEVLAEIHQASEKRKLEKKRLCSSWSSIITTCSKVADEPPAVAITPPIVVNLEDDDDDVPLALRTSLSSSRKGKLDTPKNQEPSSSKRQPRIDSPTSPMNKVSQQIMAGFENLTDLMNKMFDEQNKRLDKLEEGMKNLRGR